MGRRLSPLGQAVVAVDRKDTQITRAMCHGVVGQIQGLGPATISGQGQALAEMIDAFI